MFARYRGLNPCLLPYHVFNACTVNRHDMKSEIGSTRQDLVALSEEAGADAKLNQHEPLGLAYPYRHPIPTVLHGAQLQGKKHDALFIILII